MRRKVPCSTQGQKHVSYSHILNIRSNMEPLCQLLLMASLLMTLAHLLQEVDSACLETGPNTQLHQVLIDIEDSALSPLPKDTRICSRDHEERDSRFRDVSCRETSSKTLDIRQQNMSAGKSENCGY